MLTELLKVIPEFFKDEWGPEKSDVSNFETYTKRMKKLIVESDFEGDYSNLIRINILRLRKEYKELFWNLIFYFSYNQYNFTFMLPYKEDFQTKQSRKKSF